MKLEDEVRYYGGTIETMAGDKWKSLKVMRVPSRGVSGYTYSHEEHSHGVGVAILPYRFKGGYGADEPPELEALLRVETVPPWGLNPTVCAITGSWDHEGESFEQIAVRELLEEAGYTVTEKDMRGHGTCRVSKGSDTMMMLFSVDVTEMPQGKATGDGSRLEKEGATRWVALVGAFLCEDPVVSVMAGRLMQQYEFTSV